MSKKVIILVSLIFILVTGGMFGFAYLNKQDTADTAPVVPEVVGNKKNTYGITQIDGTHFYIDGVHTIVGELPMPTPCDLLATDATVAESMPEQIMLRFDVINNSPTCIEQETTQRFKVSATASNQATFSATFMGDTVKLNLVEAAPGETPEDFELFIKG